MATALWKWARVPLIAVLLVIGFALCVRAWPQSPALTVIVTGQSMIRSDLRASAPSAVPAIASLLGGGDVVFTNFEGAIIEAGQPNENAPRQGPGYLAPPGALDALKALGFNLVSLSNNHSWDLKVPGVQNTLREVGRLDLAHAGIGNTLQEAAAPGYLRTPKGTVALVAMASGLIADGAAATATRPGVDELRIEAGGMPNESTTVLPAKPGNEPNPEDRQRILQSIRDARQRADLVIVYEHNHVFLNRPFNALFYEQLPERLGPADWLKKWTHEEIDAGADIIVMHGAPLLHGVEIYRDRPIFYDLGNFIFNVPPTAYGIQEPTTWESVVASVEFQGKRLQSVRLRPIALNFIGQGQPELHDPYANNLYLDTRGLPAPAKGDQARYILERLAEASRPFGTTVEIDGDTAEIKVNGRG